MHAAILVAVPLSTGAPLDSALGEGQNLAVYVARELLTPHESPIAAKLDLSSLAERVFSLPCGCANAVGSRLVSPTKATVESRTMLLVDGGHVACTR
jgi:hypothetical protein